MSIFSLELDRFTTFRPILTALKERRYKLIILLAGTVYSILYMFFVGIISYYPGFASAMTTPVVRFTSYGISIVPFSNFFIFIFYYAIVFLAISTFLVGLNTALILYSRKLSKSCMIRNIGSKGILGFAPAFFTSFACCGGGLLTLVIGPAAFSSLSVYSNLMAPLTIAIIGAGTYMISKTISKNKVINMTQ